MDGPSRNEFLNSKICLFAVILNSRNFTTRQTGIKVFNFQFFACIFFLLPTTSLTNEIKILKKFFFFRFCCSECTEVQLNNDKIWQKGYQNPTRMSRVILKPNPASSTPSDNEEKAWTEPSINFRTGMFRPVATEAENLNCRIVHSSFGLSRGTYFRMVRIHTFHLKTLMHITTLMEMA